MDVLDVPICNPFVVDALDVVKLIFIYPGDDPLNSNLESCFKPKMAHQVFGPDETIFGYKKLQICIFYHHNTAHCLLTIKHDDVIKVELIKPDDIYKQLEPFLPEKYYTDPEIFVKDLINMDTKKMFGVPKFTFANANPKDPATHNCYTITACSMDEDDFKEFHKRYQTLIIWFIDAANFIDLEDPRWEIMYLYEQQENGIMTPVGFCTVYKFYAHPDKIRARISQFFILPTHQCLGLGSRFLACVYEILWKIPNLKDIVVEDPSEVFRKMRNTHDARIALTLDIMNQRNLHKVYTAEMKQKMENICKVPKHQCRIVYEIIAYANVMDNDLERNEFLLKVVKPRIVSEYMTSLRKLRNSIGKQVSSCRSLSPAEMDSKAEKLYQKYLKEVLQMTAYSIRKLYSFNYVTNVNENLPLENMEYVEQC